MVRRATFGPTFGFEALPVSVDSVDLDANVITVVDQFGKRRTLRPDVRRGGGPMPKVGEHWIIDHTLGFWSFAAQVGQPEAAPSVTGSRGGNAALASLLTALDDLGVVRDETTA